MQLKVFNVNSWTPRDFIAILVIIVLAILLLAGHNGQVSLMMVMVITYYFVRRTETQNQPITLAAKGP